MKVPYNDLSGCSLDDVRSMLQQRPRFVRFRGSRFDLRALVDDETGDVYGWELSEGARLLGIVLSASDLIKRLDGLR